MTSRISVFVDNTGFHSAAASLSSTAEEINQADLLQLVLSLIFAGEILVCEHAMIGDGINAGRTMRLETRVGEFVRNLGRVDRCR